MWGNEIPLPPFHLNVTPFLPQFYLILTSLNLNLTSAQPAISNHGLETTVYIPLVKVWGLSPKLCEPPFRLVGIPAEKPGNSTELPSGGH